MEVLQRCSSGLHNPSLSRGSGEESAFFRAVPGPVGAVLTAAQHPLPEWCCQAALLLAEFNQSREMRAAQKRSVSEGGRGGMVRTSWGFNQVTLQSIPGRSGLGSWECHRGMAPELFSLGTFLKPLKTLTFPTSNGYVITFISGFNGFFWAFSFEAI